MLEAAPLPGSYVCSVCLVAKATTMIAYCAEHAPKSVAVGNALRTSEAWVPPPPKPTCAWCNGKPVTECAVCQARPSSPETYNDDPRSETDRERADEHTLLRGAVSELLRRFEAGEDGGDLMVVLSEAFEADTKRRQIRTSADVLNQSADLCALAEQRRPTAEVCHECDGEGEHSSLCSDYKDPEPIDEHRARKYMHAWGLQDHPDVTRMVPARAAMLATERQAGRDEQRRESGRPAVVWADDASPFTGPQVLALLRENEALRKVAEAARKLEAALLRHDRIHKRDDYVGIVDGISSARKALNEALVSSEHATLEDECTTPSRPVTTAHGSFAAASAPGEPITATSTTERATTASLGSRAKDTNSARETTQPLGERTSNERTSPTTTAGEAAPCASAEQTSETSPKTGFECTPTRASDVTAPDPSDPRAKEQASPPAERPESRGANSTAADSSGEGDAERARDHLVREGVPPIALVHPDGAVQRLEKLLAEVRAEESEACFRAAMETVNAHVSNSYVRKRLIEELVAAEIKHGKRMANPKGEKK